MLYLIKSSNYIKIGFTNNINNRMKAYNTCNPDYELLDTVEGTEEDESNFHNIISKYHYRGEWFYFNQEILDIWNSTFGRKVFIKLTKENLTEENLRMIKIEQDDEYYQKTQALMYRENFVLNNLKILIDTNQPFYDFLVQKIEESDHNKYLETIRKKDNLILQMYDTIKGLSEIVKMQFPDLNVNLNLLTTLNLDISNQIL